ncbi:MAG: cytochrome P450, partial [Chitinophagaceae bacterium]
WKKQPSGQRRDISKDFLKLTLGNITKTMFGTDVKQDLDKIATIINNLVASASSSVISLIKIPLYMPTPSNTRFLKANREFEKIIYNIIEERKKENKETSSDLLDLLLHAYDDESQSYMTVQQLRDEITTIFMAGHETTAQTLSWVFYQLALNPGVYKEVKKEAVTISSGKVTMDRLQKLQ